MKINKLLSKQFKKFLFILQSILNNTFKLVTIYTTIKTSKRLRFIKLFYYLLN